MAFGEFREIIGAGTRYPLTSPTAGRYRRAEIRHRTVYLRSFAMRLDSQHVADQELTMAWWFKSFLDLPLGVRGTGRYDDAHGVDPLLQVAGAQPVVGQVVKPNGYPRCHNAARLGSCVIGVWPSVSSSVIW
jgi:hypothetical protein